VAAVRHLGPTFAARAAAHDANDSFVADNYAAVKQRKVFSAGVPAELGGGGASHAELCALLRELAHACGATALALSMHTHLLAATVWRWRQGQPVEPLLRRIANDESVLISTGASDWLESSGNTANAILIRKTIAARAAVLTAEKALEVVGGAGFFRSLGLEHLLRDVHGASFDPLPEKRQLLFTGRLALGLDPIG
jgi:alkylation response protein AidB-like acyl-CoA dehydrogenase